MNQVQAIKFNHGILKLMAVILSSSLTLPLSAPSCLIVMVMSRLPLQPVHARWSPVMLDLGRRKDAVGATLVLIDEAIDPCQVMLTDYDAAFRTGGLLSKTSHSRDTSHPICIEPHHD